MLIFVTGVTGRVGSRVVPRLLADGASVRALVRDPGNLRHACDQLADMEVVMGGLLDSEAIYRGLEGVDAVVHFAATTGTTVSEAEQRSVNTDAVAALGAAAVRSGVRTFVFASTHFVYGPGRGRPAREDDEPRPTTSYAAGKLAAEDALRRLHLDSGLGLRVLRLSLVYGEGDPHLSKAMLRARGWPAHRRLTMIHHADVAQAVGLALRAEGVDGRSFNVADDAPMTAAELCRLDGAPAPDDGATPPLTDPWEGIVDTSQLRAGLGFRPIYPTLYTAIDAAAL